jgi:ribose transport system permease protein
VGNVYRLSAVVCAMLIRSQTNPWLAAALALVVAVGLGAVNALIANVLRLPAIIVTLGAISSTAGSTYSSAMAHP